MIRAYFDDSGDHERQRFVCWGGILGDDLQLQGMESAWDDATKYLELPFRATDCECQHGQFRNWTKSECDSLMAVLVSILAKFRIGAFACVVPILQYRDVFPYDDRRGPERLAVMQTFINMARLGKKCKEMVETCFEQSSNDGLIRTAHSELMKHEAWDWSQRQSLSKKLSFGTKSSRLLQAADLVAREGFKVADNLGKRKLRKPLLELWERAGVIMWSRDGLKELKDLGGPYNPKALTTLPDRCYVYEKPQDGRRFFTR